MTEKNPNTPWGPAEDSFVLGPDVFLHMTARHGGLQIGEAAQAAIPVEVRDTFRNGHGWAEEDDEYPIALAFLLVGGKINPQAVHEPAGIYKAAREKAAAYPDDYGVALPLLPQA